MALFRSGILPKTARRPTRRDFVRDVAAATAGFVVTSGNLFRQAPARAFQTVVPTPYTFLNTEQYKPRREHRAGGRLDFQLSSRTHLSARGTWYDNTFFDPQGNNVTRGIQTDRVSKQFFASLTQVVSRRAVNEIKGGYFGYLFGNNSVQRGDLPGIPPLPGFNIVPGVLLTGLTIGQTGIIPAGPTEDDWSIRDDLTLTIVRGGHQTLKLGGEFIRKGVKSYSCRTCMGILDAQGGPVPASLAEVFPNPKHANTWRLNLLPSSIVAVVLNSGSDSRSDTSGFIWKGVIHLA